MFGSCGCRDEMKLDQSFQLPTTLYYISNCLKLCILATFWCFFLILSVMSTEHPVLWHALVMWASNHGVDQRLCDADESAAASQILWPASSLIGSPRPLAKAGARLIQQRTSAFVSGHLHALAHKRRFTNVSVNRLCTTVVFSFRFVDGQKVLYGLRGCWYDTVDVCIRQSDPIMLLCPLMFLMQDFMWVFFLS